MMRNPLLLFFLCLILPFPGHSSENVGIRFDVNKINDHVYVFAQPFGQTWINFGAVVGDEGVVLITSMMQQHAEQVSDVVEKTTGQKIKYVVNIDQDTYQHSANGYFAAQGATVIAQQSVREVSSEVDIGYQQEITLDVGTELVTAIHTAARNPGDSIVVLKNSNVIFTGDTFRNDWLMYSKNSGPKAHIKALDFIADLGDQDTKYVPGNRKSIVYSGTDELKKVRNLYHRFVEKVKAFHIQGFSVEEISKQEDIHQLTKSMERYEQFKGYINTHVEDIVNSLK